jgi:uncharacterized protein involved in exopolysaccharide biosynthesis
MLQKLDFEEEEEVQREDRSYLLRPAFYLQLLQRRWLYFLIPFVIIAPVGFILAKSLPAVYFADGKILVESQQIPTELVRPTVTSAAQERVQVIEQRTMTRDNLLAVADKFNLFPDKRQFMSATDVVELMKKSIKIAPVDTGLDFKVGSRTPTIIFSVGFEAANPQAAAQVANELITRILDEDLRDRNSRASDTTNFLAREVQKLQAESNAQESKIAQLKVEKAAQDKLSKADSPSTLLSQMKAELAAKSALYSEKHPVLQSLRRQIQAMERELSSSAKVIPSAAKVDANLAASLDALQAQHETLQKNLDAAQTKLATARVGESLEKDQQSEKLEVIEQPRAPSMPLKPNRTKIAGMGILLAAAAGAGLAFIAELADKAIRRSSDIYAVVDSRLVVSIPYLTTAEELRARKRRMFLITISFSVLAVVAVIGALLLIPLDLLIAKARVGLFR